jgi:hypothetical protein
MAWARVDDSAYTHPKFLTLDPAAIGLWAMALSYTADHLTDGFIPRAQLPRFIAAPAARALKLAGALVKAGLWEERGDGYQVHDFTDWNAPAEEIRRKRQLARDRQERYREGKTGRFGNASPHAPDNASRGALVTSTHATPRSNTPLPPSFEKQHDSVTASPGGRLHLPAEAAGWVHEDGCPKTEHLDRFPADRQRQCGAHRAAGTQVGRADKRLARPSVPG